MRKISDNFQQNSKQHELEGKQKMLGFKKSLRNNIQQTEVICKPKKLFDDQQNKLLELQEFKKSKLKIEQVINQSKIKVVRKNKDQVNLINQKLAQSQQEEYIPCPFCATPLLLIDLGHIQNCKQGKKCSYCEQKYPVNLFTSHLQVCQKRPTNKLKMQFQFSNKRIKTLASQRFSMKDQKMQEIMKKYMPSNKQKNQEPSSRFNLDLERKYSSRRLQISPRIQVQPIRSNKQHQQIRQNIQAPINYSQYFNQVSRLRAEKQKGLSNKEIRSLRRETWNQKIGDCVICSEDFRPKAIVLRLSCSHIFHQDCLLPWFQSSRRCPTCRKQM